MFRSTSNREGGFQLVDVMMGTTVLLFGLIGMIRAVTIGSEYIDTARKLQVANQIVTAEVEKLRGGAWSTLTNLPASGSITINSSGTVSGDATSFALANHTADKSDDNKQLCMLARGFRCSFDRADLRPIAASSSMVTYLKIDYTVSWTSNTGRAKSQRVSAYFGKNGLHLSYQQS
jgi:hypothetical protein